MEKRFERGLLLSPANYSLTNSLRSTLSRIASEVKVVDVRSFISSFDSRLNSQVFRFPHSVRRKWEHHFQARINTRILDLIGGYSPDLVIVYNSQFLMPETCRSVSSRSKLVFFMGDSPFYTPQNNYYLSCLSHADLILSPDSCWADQLNTMGIRKTLYFIPGADEASYFRINREEADLEEETEILYVGACYLNSWGYKKALLMDSFTGFNFRLYGNSAWRRWFSFFPSLEDVYSESNYIPQQKLNRMYNRTRVIPVDGNPGILCGIHLRMFEALAAGALPLIEYRKDVDGRLFNGFENKLPLIKDYKSAAAIASEYLKDNQAREQLVSAMNAFLRTEYSHELNAMKLSEALK
ncbi:MAG: glycosyltransferase family protein [Bacteroidales bacterium]|jgi:glycosyltransferase involved in cell wall biosynthesis